MPTIEKVNSAKNIRASIRYARDSKDKRGYSKLHDKIGINCNPENAEDDFEATNFVNNWSNRNHIQLKKFVLGFGPLTKSTLSAREAHIYAESLLNKYNRKLGGGWRIAAYAHKDHPESYHYHVLIDNCNLKTGKKLTSIYKDVNKLRDLNDEVSQSFDIKPVQKTRLVAKNMQETKGQVKAQRYNKPRYSYQDHARVLISKAMMNSSNFQEFQYMLEHNNANLKSNFTNTKAKYGTIIIPSIQPNYHYNHDKNGKRSKRKIRTGKLGLAFDKKNILEQLSRPISQRNNKYMNIYRKYSSTPNSVISKYSTTTPFMSNDNKKKTSSKYLSQPIVRNSFKTKEEINHERQFNLIRTIKELNRRFEAEKPTAKKPEQLFVESGSKGNRQKQQIGETGQAAKRPIGSIRKQHPRADKSSIKRAKQSVKQARGQIESIQSFTNKKSGFNSTSEQFEKAKSRQPSSLESKQTKMQPTIRYQQAITFSNQHIRITDENQGQYNDEDKKLLPRTEQQEINIQEQQSQQNVGWLQKCQQAFRNIRRTEWKRVHRELSKFNSLVNGIRETLRDNARYVRSLTRSLSERYNIKKQSNENNQHQGRYSENQEYNARFQKRHETIGHKDINSFNSRYSQDNHQLELIQKYNNKIYPKLEKSNSKLDDLSDTRFNAEVENHTVGDELTDFDKHRNIEQRQKINISPHPHHKINRGHHRGPHLG